MADLGMTSETIHEQIQSVWGWADDDAGEKAEALFHMNQAYRRLIKGEHPVTRVIHLWSWLRKTADITLVDGTNTYDLADDFGGKFPGEEPFYVHEANEDFPNLREISQRRWNELNEPEDADEEDKPRFYVIKPKPFVAATGQRWQISFFPTPDEAHDITVPYKALPAPLTDDATYHLGGPEYDLILYYGALAEMEKKKGTPDGPYEGYYKEHMIDAIEHDSAYTDFSSPCESFFDGPQGIYP